MKSIGGHMKWMWGYENEGGGGDEIDGGGAMKWMGGGL